MVLGAIYIVATLLSSLSILTCDHHNHICDHHGNNHSSICHCEGLAFEDDCCHDHLQLSDNHDAYVVASERGLRTSYVVAHFALFTLGDTLSGVTDILHNYTSSYLYDSGDEESLSGPCRHASGLRAPPACVS